MELLQAQKILLRFNVDMKNSSYCYKMTYRTNGHGKVALGPKLAMDRVWDQQYVEEMGEYFPWIQQQWDSMCTCAGTRTGTTTVTITRSTL